MPRKPLSLMYCQTFGGRSRWTWVVSQSVMSSHSSSVSTSRKRCSSGDSVGGCTARSLFQSGLPEKRSPSHQTVPASIASFSVCDIGGRILRNAERTPSLISLRRSAVTLSGIASSTNATASASVSHAGRRCATQATPRATASATVQAMPAALT